MLTCAPVSPKPRAGLHTEPTGLTLSDFTFFLSSVLTHTGPGWIHVPDEVTGLGAFPMSPRYNNRIPSLANPSQGEIK